ncbi:Hypothetical predicted protein [Olea europaea subsp. europaea]|uniref:Uncharacterized protein n=1 Tax=Olea europaea subsp. europaea TaxID=158383 RepID=A0A8S0QWN4_OLEEU|nr:Hypothetical predicted protein [Olea europaea subsp. europaea]
MDWINLKAKELRATKYILESNLLLHHPIPLSSQSNASQNSGIASVLDPTTSKRKGAPRKLRRKSPLELKSNKVKATSNASKGKRLKARATNMEVVASIVQTAQRPQSSTPTIIIFTATLGDGDNCDVLQYILHSTFIYLSPTNFILNGQREVMSAHIIFYVPLTQQMPYYSQHLRDEVSRDSDC